jgi:hypothetical protein
MGTEKIINFRSIKKSCFRNAGVRDMYVDYLLTVLFKMKQMQSSFFFFLIGQGQNLHDLLLIIDK